MLKSCLFLVFITCFSGVLWAEEKGPSKPFWTSRVVEKIGTVKAGTEFDHKFSVKNPFDGTFTVENIESSCKCTAIKLVTNSAAKGEMLHISVKIKPGTPGAFRQSVALEGHVGGVRAGLAIAFAGSVKAGLELENPERAWTIRTDLPPEKSALELVVCSHWNDQKWSSPKVSLSHNSFQAVVVPDEERDNCWKVKITPDLDPSKVKIVNLNVTVYQTNEKGERRQARTRLFVRRARTFQAVLPQRVQLRAIGSEDNPKQSLTIKFRVYINSVIVRQPLLENQFRLEVESPDSRKTKRLKYTQPEVTAARFMCDIDQRDIYSCVEALGSEPSKTEDGNMVLSGNIVVTYVPSNRQIRVPIVQRIQ